MQRRVLSTSDTRFGFIVPVTQRLIECRPALRIAITGLDYLEGYRVAGELDDGGVATLISSKDFWARCQVCHSVRVPLLHQPAIPFPRIWSRS